MAAGAAALVLLLLSTFATLSTGSLEEEAAAPEPPEWEDWVLAHARVYGSHEEAEHRRQIYLREATQARQHNARASRGLETYTVAVNEWSDLTHAEWAARMGLTAAGGLLAAGYNRSGAEVWLPEDGRGTTTSLDWRAKGAVTGDKDQGGCGACWSFGATGTMEGAWFLAGHKLQSLSEEQLIHCSGQNCGGGNPGHAIDYVVHNRGIDSERDYRYTAKNGGCDGLKAGRHVAAMTAARNVPQRNERQLMAAVLRQPVAVAIDAIHGGFRGYHRGVLGGKCGEQIDHSVLIVGFGEQLLPPPPPPGPLIACQRPTVFLGCFNIENRSSALLPREESLFHDRLTLERCAMQCAGHNLSAAGVDTGNHCRCGVPAQLATSEAKELIRPMAECLVSNCTAASTGCVCRAVGGCPCDEKCGGAGRMLAWAVNCTITAPPPSPAPPPRAIPYWIVKNSWSASYGDHGYIKMQRGAQGSAGLCCINCMPQYAVSAKGPPPARPSLIPYLCTTFTRAGIEWCRCHHAVCMARPYKEPRHSGQAEP